MIATLGYLVAAAVVGGIVWLLAALRITRKGRIATDRRNDDEERLERE